MARKAKTSKKATSKEASSKPLRWDELPHHELWLQAHRSMDLESSSRSATDALQSVLKKRLYRMDHDDHRRYVEIECARIVETLRVVRDTYREYLRPKIDGPLVEMYWVVVRFGVKDWAVMRLRDAATEYMEASKITESDWVELFGLEKTPMYSPGEEIPEAATQRTCLDAVAIQKAVKAFLRAEVFDLVSLGGPFGRDSQLRLARTSGFIARTLRHETFPQSLERRFAKWDECKPWTEGLARLFDAAQEEVLRQFASLSFEAHKAETAMLELSLFDQIVYKHLVSLKHRAPATASPPEGAWRRLLEELDKRRVPLESNLDETARATLTIMQKKGASIKTWIDCYASTAGATLDDGKLRTLRREMTHSLHNAARNTAQKLERIWGKPKKR